MVYRSTIKNIFKYEMRNIGRVYSLLGRHAVQAKNFIFSKI